MRKCIDLSGIALATLLSIFASCTADDEGVRRGGTEPSNTAGRVVIQTLEGEPFSTVDSLALAADGSSVNTLYLFVGVTCPISNALSPEMGRIQAEYSDRPLSVYLVYTDPDESPSTIREHVKDYQLGGAVLLDYDHLLAKSLGISVTPEAALVSPEGELVYRGRIDDRYVDFGKQRAAPGRRDLRLALDAVFAGELPEVQRTVAIGCYLPELAGGARQVLRE